MVDSKLEKINIKSITPADYNPRKISDKDYENLKQSIDEFGVVDPIIVNLKDNTIISGHQRFDVLFYENELDELNLLRLGDIGWVFPDTNLEIKDKNHEKALNLALNRIHGEFDEDLVNQVLNELEEFNLDHLTGFDLDFDDIDYDFITRMDDEYEEEYDEEDEIIEEDIEEIPEIQISEQKTSSSPQSTKPTKEKRIRRGFVRIGDIYQIGDASFLMFGNENNEQDRSKLFSLSPIVVKSPSSSQIPFKKIKTTNQEINYYISDDAEEIEKYLIENDNICKKIL